VLGLPIDLLYVYIAIADIPWLQSLLALPAFLCAGVCPVDTLAIWLVLARSLHGTLTQIQQLMAIVAFVLCRVLPR
jgi:uncharacterized MAPEG superfamily protein